MPAAHPEPGLWASALELYGAPGVATACLELQDASGVDVPLLLLAAWLSRRSVRLTPGDVARLDSRVAEWRREVVQPLRALRRRLRAGPPPAPGAGAEAVRDAVKAAELEAERMELRVLEEAGLALAGTAAADRPELARANLAAVVRHFRGSEPDEAAGRALAVIGEALEAR